MAKKALISTLEPNGNNGYRIVEVVEIGNEFETHFTLEWKECSDSVTPETHWYDPINNTFKQLPLNVNPVETAGALATDSEGNETEEYEWNWDTETWSKVQIINQ